ncbi:transporter [Roseateles sp. BYS96W]|uniref:Transporter n=1 Tax=Pelomonas nitida TaxID=3299027 RepID=A0ABW7GCC3_9BURK
MRKPIRRVSPLIALVMMSTPVLSAHAADEPLATDRPDFVESSDVVGRGRLQIETSIAGERQRQAGTTARLSSTPTLLRIGISDSLELRVETDGRLRARSSDASGVYRESGWADTAIGIKWHQRDGDEERMTPGIGWLLHVDIDSGSGPFRGDGLRPSLRMVAEWEFAGGWTAGLMPGLYQDRDASGRYIGGILAGVVGKSFTQRLRGFIEVSGQQLTSKRHGGQATTLDTGLACLLSPDLQIDIAASRGLSTAAPDFGWTLGLSARF